MLGVTGFLDSVQCPLEILDQCLINLRYLLCATPVHFFTDGTFLQDGTISLRLIPPPNFLKISVSGYITELVISGSKESE